MTVFPKADFAWSQKGAPAHLLSILNAEGEARFVGGCVRDSLLGLPPGPEGRTDIDIATTLLPERVMEILAAAEIRHIPTGVEHGTVTAVIDRVPFEITTLRADVETDGRRAVVAFTKDWEKDASRRDFTINALYLSENSTVTDFHDGQADLAEGRVRFIGDGEDRLREDYLRILRFLRFSARYADKFDEEGWNACVRLAEGIDSLSKERIWNETAKLFTATKSPEAFARADADNVLERICPASADPEMFTAVHAGRNADVPPALGLASLWPEASRETLQAAFKPASTILDGTETLKTAAQMVSEEKAPLEILYAHGRDNALMAADLSRAISGTAMDVQDHAILTSAEIPVLPLKGADFVALGVPKGPMVGDALKKFEAEWIAAGFPDDTETIDRLAKEVVSAA